MKGSTTIKIYFYFTFVLLLSINLCKSAVTDNDLNFGDFTENENRDINNREIKTNKKFTPAQLPCKCGKSNEDKKIVGGVVSQDHVWPWMAAIVTHNEGGIGTPMVICGGSIINSKFILTAAHCAKPVEEEGINKFRIYVGENNITTTGTYNILEIESVQLHPKYNSTTQEYDVGLIKLKRELIFNSNVLPICLGHGAGIFLNRNAVVAGKIYVGNCGWGTTKFAGQSITYLKQTTVKVIGNKKCSKKYLGSDKPVTRNMLCAFYPDTGSCQGDSGGPLFVRRFRSSNVYRQIGIVAYGIGCADNQYPEVYTRVQRVLSWIRALTKTGKYCKNSFS